MNEFRMLLTLLRHQFAEWQGLRIRDLQFLHLTEGRLVLFGGAKLPGLAKGIGQSIKEFKKASKDEPEPAKPAEAPAKTADGAGKPPAA